MMHQGLPSHPNLEYYRKRAKALLKACQSGNESAALRMGSPSRTDRTPGLCDAQRVVARETGFESWSLLKLAILAAPHQETPSAAAPEDPDPVPAEQRRSKRKQRYERDPNVQRWLRSRDAGETQGFAPRFLVDHRERDWIMSALEGFHAKGLITDVVGLVKAGKEATVYRCVPADGRGHLAAKIYRPRMFRNLQNDIAYRQTRMPEKDRRSQKAMDKKSRRGRSFRMESWIRFEFETQALLFDADVDVPRPLDLHDNGILMELIGDEERAAPMLCDVALDEAEARLQFERLMRAIELMLACDRVHADLSAYNVLYWNGRSTVIDLAQAVDARSGPDALGFLMRDVDRLARYFARYGVTADAREIAADMWSRYERGALQPSPARERDGGVGS